MTTATILIVEDDAPLANTCVRLMQSNGYKAMVASSGEQAVQVIEAGAAVDIVLTDLVMGGMDGLTLLKWVKQRCVRVPVIVMTSYGTIDSAVEAMKLGASDYVTKPFKGQELLMCVGRVLQVQAMASEIDRLRTELEGVYGFDNLVGANPQMRRIYELIRTLGDADVSVLIQGDTGTGKELVAKAIHYNSARRARPFVKVDCAALTETLLESELFGHVEGAFTGATAPRVGRFKAADTGTLFLDEVGNIPLPLQAKLLRVLQDKQFEPVGGDNTVTVDVRVIAASNVPLQEQADSGTFRRDLFYRLNVVSIFLPPLRDRKEDIPLLAAHFLKRLKEKHSRPQTRLSQAGLDRLLLHDWPGNVRELENAIEHAVLLCKGDVIEPGDLSVGAQSPHAPERPGGSLKEMLREAERRALLGALRAADWNKARAARSLGISRSSFYGKLKEFGVGRHEP